MTQDDLCNSCGKAKTCRQVYEKLGKVKGPSIAVKAVVAFLLPIVVFIASLVLFEKLLENLITTKHPRTAIGVLAALAVTFTIILITRYVNRHNRQKSK